MVPFPKSNPKGMTRKSFQKRNRGVKKTILMYGEGLTEKIFLKYLKWLYIDNNKIAIKIKSGRGGSPKSLVVGALKEIGSFGKKIVVLDNDRGKKEIEEARDKAREKSIVILENSPCLEATFLSILHPEKEFSNKKSKWCKREFKAKYVKGKNRTDLEEYKRVFPKQILDKRKSEVPELEILINLIQGKE